MSVSKTYRPYCYFAIYYINIDGSDNAVSWLIMGTIWALILDFHRLSHLSDFIFGVNKKTICLMLFSLRSYLHVYSMLINHLRFSWEASGNKFSKCPFCFFAPSILQNLNIAALNVPIVFSHRHRLLSTAGENHTTVPYTSDILLK